MPAAQFSHAAAGTINFKRSPQRASGSMRMLQPSAKSSGGVRFVHNPTMTLKPLPLSWQGMPAADLQSLEAFFLTVGLAESFSYTDTDGVAHTVYIDNPEISSSEVAHGRHEVTVELVEA